MGQTGISSGLMTTVVKTSIALYIAHHTSRIDDFNHGLASFRLYIKEELVLPWQCAGKSVPLRPNQIFSPPKFTPIVMEVRNYETVFIVTPVLNESQVQETVEKFTQVLKENSAAIVSTEVWGLRKLAYPIQKKTTGYYFCLSFTGEGNIVDVLELAFRRDERIIRFLTTVLDKHAVEYNNRRRNGEMNQQKAAKETEAVAQ